MRKQYSDKAAFMHLLQFQLAAFNYTACILITRACKYIVRKTYNIRNYIGVPPI
jgi:hypothetical protein